MNKVASHFAILLGGDLTVTSRLREQIAGARVIAADSGIRHAHTLGVTPELWLGDFDSSGNEDTLARDIPRQVFPVAKDKTDGALAIEEALRRGSTFVSLVGGFGGRFDHALGHGTQLLALARQGIGCFMTSGNEEAYPLLHSCNVTGLKAGTQLSILGFDSLEGLTISGVRWPLQEANVPFGSTWTLSNESVGDVHVSLRKGKALVIAYPWENAK